jgi:hypothetical protein
VEGEVLFMQTLRIAVGPQTLTLRKADGDEEKTALPELPMDRGLRMPKKRCRIQPIQNNGVSTSFNIPPRLGDQGG